jgi:hypothetical protein
MFRTQERISGNAMTDNDRQMEIWFSTYVSKFIRAGDPNGNGLPAWPTSDSATLDLMNFTLDDGPVYATLVPAGSNWSNASRMQKSTNAEGQVSSTKRQLQSGYHLVNGGREVQAGALMPRVRL